MIAFIVGTTAELIKIAPVHRELSRFGVSPQLWSTNQQSAELDRCVLDLELGGIDVRLPERPGRSSLETVSDAARWLWSLSSQTIRRRSELRQRLWADGHTPLVVVHGDTLTAAAGSVVAQLLRVDVAHIEAGLRSGHLLDPFPEELNRRLIGRLADLHFAPASHHLGNLGGRGEKIDTITNTVVDALSLARSISDRRGYWPGSAAEIDLRVDDTPVDLRVTTPLVETDYGIVSLHRFELLRDRDRFSDTLRVLSDVAARRQRRCLFVEDAQVRARIAALGLRDVFHEWFVSIGKLEYTKFVGLMDSAEWVITDSGGLQEEAAALGLPCLLARNHTERSDGLQHNARLVGTDLAQFEDFICDPGPRVGRAVRGLERASTADFDGPLQPSGTEFVDPSASAIIAERLIGAGYAASSETNASATNLSATSDLSVVVVARALDGLTRSALRNLTRAVASSGQGCEVVLVLAGTVDAVDHASLAPGRVDQLIRVSERASGATMLNLGIRAAGARRVLIASPEPLLDAAAVNCSLEQARELGVGEVAVGVRSFDPRGGTWTRRMQRSVFAEGVRLLLGLRVSDPHPLVMAVQREQFLALSPYVQANTYAFYPELLSRLVDSGSTLREFSLDLPFRQRAISDPRRSLAAAVALAGVGVTRVLGKRARTASPNSAPGRHRWRPVEFAADRTELADLTGEQR